MKKSFITRLTIIFALFLCIFYSCEKESTPIPFNDQPQLFSETYSIFENAPSGLILDTAYIEDSVVLGTLIYEILDGNDEEIFYIGRYDGILSLKDSTLLNYDIRNSYELKIAVTDSCKYPVSSMAILKINILEFIPFNDHPQLFSENYNIFENAPSGLILDTAHIEDSIILGTLIYEILEGNNEEIFHIGKYNGILSLKDSTLLNYDITNSYELKIVVTDSCKYPVSSKAILKINILEYIPYNDPIILIAEHYQVPEHPQSNFIIDTLTVLDSVTIGHLTYEIIRGDVEGIFNIDQTSGALFVQHPSLLDYEKTSKYELDIKVTDNCKHPLSATARYVINVIDIEETLSLTYGLVAYYPFDGNMNDYSTSNNNGINHTDGNYFEGIHNQALQFNGTSDYIELEKTINCSNGLSFSFWIKPKKVIEGQKNGCVISKYNMGGARCFFINSFHNPEEINFVSARFFSSGSSSQYFDGSFSYIDSATASNYAYQNIVFHNPQILDEDKWAHCLINTTETEIQIWVNGQHCSTKPRGYSSYYDNSSEPVVIGTILSGGEGSNNYFHGALDDFRIYNRALSEEEIQILYKE